jgi:hypothetical protein
MYLCVCILIYCYIKEQYFGIYSKKERRNEVLENVNQKPVTRKV